MRITRRQLRKLVQEARHGIADAGDYDQTGELSQTRWDGSGEEADPRLDYEKRGKKIKHRDHPGLDFIKEDSGEEEGKNYLDNEKEDEKHLKHLEKDIDFDKRHIHEQGPALTQSMSPELESVLSSALESIQSALPVGTEDSVDPEKVQQGIIDAAEALEQAIGQIQNDARFKTNESKIRTLTMLQRMI